MLHRPDRRRALQALGSTLALGAVAAPARADAGGPSAGLVFTSTNAVAGNELLVFEAALSGAATFRRRIATLGLGAGSGLGGSQGAVTLSSNRRHLFVVNAGSNTVSTFTLRGSHEGADWRLSSVVDSGGLRPTSVTERNGLVYVLNAGGAGQVNGFRLREGTLLPLPDGTRPLSAAGGTNPAQVSLDESGEVLVVSERATRLLDSWPVRPDGSLGPRVGTTTPGVTPFGFAITRRDVLVLSEAASGSASSFTFDKKAPAVPLPATAALATTQGAPCWVAVTPDGRFAYTANAASSSVSALRVARDGTLTLLAAAAGSTQGNGAVDMAVDRDGALLHVLAARGGFLYSFAIGDDGLLTPLGSVGGVQGAAGLAAV